MNGDDRHNDAIEELVQRFLESEAERVDADAFLARLNERRARRLVRLRAPLLAAAAMIVAVVGVLVALRRPEHPAVPPPAEPSLLALYGWEQAVRGELAAAWEGARLAGGAVVSAGKVPFQELAAVRLTVPELPGLVDMTAEDVPPLPEGE